LALIPGKPLRLWKYLLPATIISSLIVIIQMFIAPSSFSGVFMSMCKVRSLVLSLTQIGPTDPPSVIVNEGSGEENTGIYRFQKSLVFVMKDLTRDNSMPTMELLQHDNFPMRVLDENMIISVDIYQRSCSL
jgi:hypothetical protein